MVKAAQKREVGKRKTKAGAGNRGQKKGQGALRAGSALKKSSASGKAGRTAPNGDTRVKDGGGTHFRSESTIRRIQMYRTKGELSKEQAKKPHRIQPDRRWFGNTRVIAQDKMQAFRETLSKGVEDPFSVVLKSSKLPMSLLRDTEDKASRMKLLSVEPFNEVFSKGRRQKRVKLGSYDLDQLLQNADKKASEYNEKKDSQCQIEISTGAERLQEAGSHQGEEIFSKGTSKRIWQELYKVIDSSDVLVFVLDARDPMGTRNIKLEREIRKNRPNKHIVLLLNKVDLVPTWVSRRWIQELMKEFPTLAFHASITNPFGKNALLNLLRQFGNLLKEAKHVTIGMLGYPNVGKSSVINTMKRKKVCKSAPVPGETKVWQYIALTKKIYMLDCPGIVPPTENDFSADAAKVLKGVVRAERLQQASDFIGEVLSRVKKQYLLQRYKLPADTTWEDQEEFLSILGTKMGKLQRGGEPDIETAARIVLYDWQRGRIPYFTPPPGEAEGTATSSSSAPAASATAAVEGRDAALEEAKDAEGAEAGKEGGDGKEEPCEEDAGGSEQGNSDKSGEVDREKASGPVIQQSLASLSDVVCVHAFDDEDRQGEPLPATNAAAEGRPAAGARKRKAGSTAHGDSGEVDNPSKKKAGKRRRGSARTSSAEMTVKQGSVDWKAVVSEFAM